VWWVDLGWTPGAQEAAPQQAKLGRK